MTIGTFGAPWALRFEPGDSGRHFGLKPANDAAICEKIFKENYLQKSRTARLVILLWMKGALNAPDGKRPLPPRMSETDGKHQKAGIVRHSQA